MSTQTQLDSLYGFEGARRDEVWLTQPVGGGVVRDFTFGQAMGEVRRVAAHLQSLGLPPGSSIGLFSKNTAWWLLADLAIWMAGHVSVPLYPTLTPDTIRQILEHSEAKLIFVGKLDGFKAMEPGIPQGMPRISLPLAPKGAATTTWDELVSRTEPLEGTPRRQPTDLATLMYTSGSTGTPKGVMHSFGTMCASEGFLRSFDFHARDRMLSYLPLAHAFERTIVETSTFRIGCRVFFAESLDTFMADLQRARPTLFHSVPRLWQKFQSGVFARVPREKIERGLKLPIVRYFVARKVLKGLGLDAVRLAASGSAPISAELIEWYRALGLELLEGYGMTENFSYSHVSRLGEVRVGFVGRSHDDVLCRLDPVTGEILVKSPCTMLGYFKAPDLTAAMMTDDGFLRTGDQGQLDEQGRLKITGRVKELFKTSKGKYVAPTPIENKLMRSPDIEQACVTCNNQPQPFGLVVLTPQARQAAAKDPAAKDGIEAALATHVVAVNAELDQHEQLHTLVVIPDEWTIENGLLTPTLKLKRSAIEQRYLPRAEEWFAKGKRVLWA